jgi:cytochrome c
MGRVALFSVRHYLMCAAAALFMMPAVSQAAGDAARGEEIYQECIGCHSLRENVVGPRHCGVYGRKAASLPDFAGYSEALKEAEIVWDDKQLNGFLENPLSYVQGTAMGFVGLHDAAQRADLIAYLKSATLDSPLCKAP